jgi:hypothetical protein
MIGAMLIAPVFKVSDVVVIVDNLSQLDNLDIHRPAQSLSQQG